MKIICKIWCGEFGGGAPNFLSFIQYRISFILYLISFSIVSTNKTVYTNSSFTVKRGKCHEISLLRYKNFKKLYLISFIQIRRFIQLNPFS